MIPASLARRKGVTIAVARRMNDAYPRAVDLVTAGLVQLTRIASAEYGLSKVAEAFDCAADRRGLKVVVRPQR